MPFGRWNIPQKTAFFRGPFFYFVLLVLSNSLLSYGDFSFPVRIGLLLLGTIFPLILFLVSDGNAPSGEGPLFLNEELFVPSKFLLILVLLLALVFRFYKLTDLSSWPTKDEGALGFSAMELIRSGSFSFFYGIGEVP